MVENVGRAVIRVQEHSGADYRVQGHYQRHVFRLLWWDRLLHDLARQDIEHLKGDQRAVADLRADRIGALQLEIMRLAEILRDSARRGVGRR